MLNIAAAIELGVITIPYNPPVKPSNISLSPSLPASIPQKIFIPPAPPAVIIPKADAPADTRPFFSDGVLQGATFTRSIVSAGQGAVNLGLRSQIAKGSSALSAFQVPSIFIYNYLTRLHEQKGFRDTLQKILKDPAFSKEEREKNAYEYLRELMFLTPEEKANISFEEQIRKQLKREAFVSRVASGKCVKMIKEKGIDEAGAVVKAVVSKNLQKVVLNSVKIAASTISIITGFTALIVTGPVGLITLGSIWLGVSVIWVAIEAYQFRETIEASSPGKWDKWVLLASTILCVAATVFACVYSAGILPVVTAVVIGGSWLAVNAYCFGCIKYYEWKRAQIK